MTTEWPGNGNNEHSDTQKPIGEMSRSNAAARVCSLASAIKCASSINMTKWDMKWTDVLNDEKYIINLIIIINGSAKRWIAFLHSSAPLKHPLLVIHFCVFSSRCLNKSLLSPLVLICISYACAVWRGKCNLFDLFFLFYCIFAQLQTLCVYFISATEHRKNPRNYTKQEVWKQYCDRFCC